MFNTLTRQPNKDKVCRICAQDEKFKISLFCTYAQQENIVPRIEKYLQVKMPTHEKTTKYICYECFANLKFVERCVNLAQENQKFFDNQRGRNNMFDDESLVTPPEMTEKRNINFNNDTKKPNITFMEEELDSEQLFKPTKNRPKTCYKTFPFKNNSEPESKKQKSLASDSTDSSIIIKEENSIDENCNKQNNYAHKLRLMKTFEHKFDLLKRSK